MCIMSQTLYHKQAPNATTCPLGLASVAFKIFDPRMTIIPTLFTRLPIGTNSAMCSEPDYQSVSTVSCAQNQITNRYQQCLVFRTRFPTGINSDLCSEPDYQSESTVTCVQNQITNRYQQASLSVTFD